MMKEDSSTRSWNKVDEKWCELAQTNDFRIHFIMPYTLECLGDVSGKRILDLGCGEGGYSRELAQRGATVVAIDCAEFSIKYAKDKAKACKLNILHYVRNSNDLYGIEDNYFDIVLCSMMLMDCEDLEGTMREVVRVLKPSGKLFASVLHPCFNGKLIQWQGEERDKKVVVENYFEPQQWEKPLSRGIDTTVIWRHRTLQDYVKVFVKSGLTIMALNEPLPTKAQVEQSVRIGWLQKIPMFLFWELKK